MSKIFNTALPIVGSVVLSSAAFAGNSIVASYTYDSLSGSYVVSSPVTGVFTANATSGALLNTVGDFNRILPTSQNASFPAGFVADANPANISLPRSTPSPRSTSSAALSPACASAKASSATRRRTA